MSKYTQPLLSYDPEGLWDELNRLLAVKRSQGPVEDMTRRSQFEASLANSRAIMDITGRIKAEERRREALRNRPWWKKLLRKDLTEPVKAGIL